MKTLSNVTKWALALAAVFGAVACAASFTLESQVEVVGQKGSIKITYDGHDVKAEKLPNNDRADVKFYDANGNEIPNAGATGVAQGDKVPVPAGATHCTVSGASHASSCTGCTPPSGGGGGGGMFDAQAECADGSDTRLSAQHPPSSGQPIVRTPYSLPEKWIHVFTLDGDFDGSTAWSNVSASFEVQGDFDASQLGARIAGILSSGPGAVVPGGVTIDTYVRMSRDHLGARLVVADRTYAITSASMDWNSQHFASLSANSTVYSAANGWKVFEVLVPLTSINIAVPGSGAGNSIDLTWTTYEDTSVNEIHQGAYFAIP